ncbi:NAD(P)H-quinone oxidoreductase subunit F [Aphanizomenon flos-aquae NRERC-008]|jgi:NAD(P)H-quinone oxidoreductase subunit 5|uniref:NAD(P)H-quinone oxidoreductase subunit F n=1 Tax=Aphanizomenon flos-aquae FACHB-1249 TaxID=2692889 RepID=A0ABR8IQR1_APHFL|nr:MULTISPECIES: NAD(P)H-quinone oxidoreductase subunit F [Aphanizomenon]MCE2905104.1 NAD(P)H-quinone oxidoreductase subunit F [Anabaena sp. CoA2_C59]MBD2390028.1 NAD(P)H-quinone oxidoreductase subunit F [Aphanizomenon flos-aquae FACHB-1171]MBD2555707.1 NAD(P)H-quinone oxidoreductase subunit F [Aphanizomenon flos-aquae FACHB-1290]MBD2630566.1 NAD(P)H-quinone oxidoreductase subunit F [Aphanizomenon sp. FACHB-1399]MBD2641882.1 NAD(P)H-quinone oxidoreductase subunit F [Aphanizomenon sp. FACHB-140
MNEFLFLTSWFVPLYSLLGAILTLPWTIGIIQRTGPRPAAYLNLLTTIFGFVHSLLVFKDIWNREQENLVITWFQAADFQLSFALEISVVSVGTTVLITGLSLLAQIYALGYMEKDWSLARFFGLLGFFEAALIGLAISDSLFLSYAVLEVLTLSTYLLVGFWYAQPLVVTAARDAFLTKRVGDLLLLMAVVSLSTLAGSLNFSDLYEWAQTADLNPVTSTLLCLGLIAGPAGKCAQFPLHLWLDEAMEGPNPASVMRNSLVVAGGAYFLYKVQPLLSLSPIALNTLVVLGIITAVGATLVSIAQIDIKRSLSHSTSAYMGLVFLAVGLEQGGVALMLLLSHAIAKALLFMSSGSVIYTTQTQDLTEMGGLWSKMPATTTAFVVGSAGMVTLLPLGSFWAMLAWADGLLKVSPWVIVVLILVNGLTALNLTRVFRLVFWGQPQPKSRRAPEVAWPMALPMVTLTILTLLLPLMLQQWYLLPSWESLNWYLVGSLVASTVAGVSIGATIHLHKAWSRSRILVWRFIQDLLGYDFYIDRIYRLTIVSAVALLSRISAWSDRFLVDGLVNLVGFAAIFSGQSLKYSISGQSQGYMLTILVVISVLGFAISFSLGLFNKLPF